LLWFLSRPSATIRYRKSEIGPSTDLKPAVDTLYRGCAAYFGDPDGLLWEIVFNRKCFHCCSRLSADWDKRRNVIALTMLVASCILLIPFADDIAVLVLIFSLTLAGIASTTSLNLSLLSDLLPSSGDVGRALAFVVVGGNIFGMLAPIVTGNVITATWSYNWAFAIAGALLVTGAVVILSMTRKPMKQLASEALFGRTA
jgi:MFS family permease